MHPIISETSSCSTLKHQYIGGASSRVSKIFNVLIRLLGLLQISACRAETLEFTYTMIICADSGTRYEKIAGITQIFAKFKCT
jgi:hypothetical protein